MKMNSLAVAVDENKGVAYIQRSAWEELPEFVQEGIKARMYKEHGRALTIELIDGEPDALGSDEQIEVDNLLMPDNVRSALCHYKDGVVAVTRTQNGWVHVYESGEHDCFEESPYDESVPPTAITILAYLPDEGVGSMSRSKLRADAERPFRAKGHPVFIDTSEDVVGMNVPVSEAEAITNRISERLEAQGELNLDNVIGSGEASRIAFEHLTEGGRILLDELEKASMPLGDAIVHASTVGQFIMSKFFIRCSTFDEDKPEEGWDAFRVAVETLAREPWEFFDGLEPSLFASLKAGVEGIIDGKALLELTDNPLFKRVTEAVAAGREFSEWRDDYYVARMLTTVQIMTVLVEAEG